MTIDPLSGSTGGATPTDPLAGPTTSNEPLARPHRPGATAITADPPPGSTAAGPPTARAAWHADPTGYPDLERYWDGAGWTEHRRWAWLGPPRSSPAAGSSAHTRRQPAAPSPSRELGWRARHPRLGGWKSAAAVACASALAIVPLAIAGGSPPAKGVVSASCSTDGFTMHAHAFYEPRGGGLKIYKYTYLLTNSTTYSGPGTVRGEYDNLNLKVVSNKVSLDSDYSPDDRQAGIVYTQLADVQVDADASTHVDFVAIFDVAGWFDPACSARTPALTL